MPFPPVNPYNKEEIEYREAGFEYAPQYPGSYNYNQAGIQYNEPNFTYVRRDAIISATTIGCSASLSLTFAYVYTPKRPGGVTYQNPYEYNESGFVYNERDTTVPDNRVLIDYSQSGVAYSQPTDIGLTVVVTATPARIGVTTVFSATPSVPATASQSSPIDAETTIHSPNVDANYVHIDAGISVSTTLHTPTIVAAIVSTRVVTTTTIDYSLYIALIVIPATIEVTGEVFDPDDVLGSYTATPDKVVALATLGNKEQYRLVVIPTSDIVPSIGLRDEPTPAAYALMRHYSPGPRGENIFIINGLTVQNYLPSDLSTVTRWIYGGHDSPRDLTVAEETVLLGAGYSFRVGPE